MKVKKKTLKKLLIAHNHIISCRHVYIECVTYNRFTYINNKRWVQIKAIISDSSGRDIEPDITIKYVNMPYKKFKKLYKAII